jgi:hypothetical protein
MNKNNWVTVKAGDRLKLVALYFQLMDWSEGSLTVLSEPVVKYYIVL